MRPSVSVLLLLFLTALVVLSNEDVDGAYESPDYYALGSARKGGVEMQMGGVEMETMMAAPVMDESVPMMAKGASSKRMNAGGPPPLHIQEL